MSDYKFKVTINPFGTLFNAASLSNLMEHIVSGSAVCEDDFTERNGQYFHFDFHSSCSAGDKQGLRYNLQNRISELNSEVKNFDVIIITFGTSFAYRRIHSGRVVSNCHKRPDQEFSKVLLSLTEAKEVMEKAFDSLFSSNENVKVILTVSPVRHLKDGIVENMLSKSILVQLSHELCKKYRQIEYFPAYEILMDDLRDYRFYKEDMIHPSEQAIEYIWEKFSSTYFDNETGKMLKEISKINKALRHKPFSSDRSAYQSHLQSTLQSIKEIMDQYGFLDFSKELQRVESEIL